MLKFIVETHHALVTIDNFSDDHQYYILSEIARYFKCGITNIKNEYYEISREGHSIRFNVLKDGYKMKHSFAIRYIKSSFNIVKSFYNSLQSKRDVIELE